MAGTPVEKKLDLKYIIWVCIGLVLMFFGGKIIPRGELLPNWA